jgi:hypothetical protein
MMSTVLGMLTMTPVVFGVLGTRWCPDDHEHAKTTTGRPPARPQVSHFETLIQLMLRRSPSARGGVMSCRGQFNGTEELRKR